MMIETSDGHIHIVRSFISYLLVDTLEMKHMNWWLLSWFFICSEGIFKLLERVRDIWFAFYARPLTTLGLVSMIWRMLCQFGSAKCLLKNSVGWYQSLRVCGHGWQWSTALHWELNLVKKNKDFNSLCIIMI